MPRHPHPHLWRSWPVRTVAVMMSGLLAVLTAVSALCSCDSLIYDDEGDCSTTRLVSLTYTMNMEWADAFASHVETVSLYAFDGDGVLAYEQTEAAATITAAGGVMDVSDIASGTYTLVVWALGEEATAGCYDVPTTTVGVTTIDELTRNLVTTTETVAEAAAASSALPSASASAATSIASTSRSVAATSAAQAQAATRSTAREMVDHDLTPLLHGMAEDADLTDVSGGGTRTVDVDLTLDTNQLVVVLQHLSGAEVDVTDFTFEVTDTNAALAYDNTPSGALVYYPWLTYTGTASTDDDDDASSSARRNIAGLGSGASTGLAAATDNVALGTAGTTGAISAAATSTRSSVGVAVAEFSLNRLMADADTRLTVYNADGSAVLSIPVVDYALLVRGYYNASLTDQDYLDRQSSYSMTFFLDDTNDEDNVWISTSIIINGWHLILEDINL